MFSVKHIVENLQGMSWVLSSYEKCGCLSWRMLIRPP